MTRNLSPAVLRSAAWAALAVAALALAGCDTMHSAMDAVKSKLSSSPPAADSAGAAPAAPAATAAASGTAPAADATAAAATHMSVADVQQKLNDLGFDAGKPDGIMGPHTHAALKKFQKAHGLDATGELDAATEAALQ